MDCRGIRRCDHAQADGDSRGNSLSHMHNRIQSEARLRTMGCNCTVV